jgi:HEAT repeat protein
MRQGAAEACVTLRDTRATAALVQCLQDSDANVRHAVAAALCKLGWQAETLEQHADILVALGRFEAACELGACGIDAVAALLPVLEPKAQVSAIETLSRSQSLRAMNPLASLLESPVAEVRRAAAIGLRKLEWVPTNRPQALKFALALEDWMAAAEHGAPAVAPLFNALKLARGVSERFSQIEAALCSIRDAAAAEPLLGFCRDGEVAATAVHAATALVESSPAVIAPQVLQEMADLPDVVQFTMSLDAPSGRLVRTGLDTVSAEPLRVAAAAKRASGPAPVSSTQKVCPA